MKRMHLSLDFVPIPSFCDSRFQHRSDRPSMCSSSRRSYPLSGVTVVEAGTFLAASLTTLHLQHLGATVIAIQPPAGSHERAEEQWRPATRAALTEVERERERKRERERESRKSWWVKHLGGEKRLGGCGREMRGRGGERGWGTRAGPSRRASRTGAFTALPCCAPMTDGKTRGRTSWRRSFFFSTV